MIYLIVLLFLFFMVLYVDICGKRKHEKYLYFTAYLILVLIAAFRYRVGGDSLTYFDRYPSFPTLSEFFGTDFDLLPYGELFYFFVACCKLFGESFFVFQFFHAIFINGAIFLFFFKNVKYKFISVLLYFLLFYVYFNMEILRESLSIAVFLFAVNFLINRSYLKYYFLVIVAFFFHNSSIFLATLPLLFYFLNNKKVYFIFLLIIAALIYKYIISNPSAVMSIIPAKFILKMLNYINHESTSPGANAVYLLKALALWMLLWVNKKNGGGENSFVNFIWVGFLIYLLCPAIYGFYRIFNYFSIITIVFFVNCLELIPFVKWRKKQVSLTLVSFSLIIFLSMELKIMTNNTSNYSQGTRFYNRYIPYESIFTCKSLDQREKIYYNQQYFHNLNKPSMDL